YLLDLRIFRNFLELSYERVLYSCCKYQLTLYCVALIWLMNYFFGILRFFYYSSSLCAYFCFFYVYCYFLFCPILLCVIMPITSDIAEQVHCYFFLFCPILLCVIMPITSDIAR